MQCLSHICGAALAVREPNRAEPKTSGYEIV
jgi:hypothetical protein